MNVNRRIADIYAEALLEAAASPDVEARVEEDAKLIGDVLVPTSGLLERICMPSVSRSEKSAILDRCFGGHVHEITRRLIGIIVRRGRTGLLAGLHDAVVRVRRRREEAVDVEVQTARGVDELQHRRFEEKIRNRFGAASRIRYRVNPEILGGFQVLSREKKVDHTLRNGLARLRKQLSHG